MMGVRYEWFDSSQTIMYIIVEDPWTWKEYNDVIFTVLDVIRETKHRCAIVIDIRRMRILPRDGNMLQIFLRIEKSTPLNLFVSVLVGFSYTVNVFLNIVMHMRPRAQQIMRFAETQDEAHKIISERRHDLDPS